MGVNINSAFMLEGANLPYQIPTYASCATPDPILESIQMFSKAREELRIAKLEFYQAVNEAEADNDVLTEGVLEKAWTRIREIIDSVIRALVDFKNFIVRKIMGAAKKNQEDNKKKHESISAPVHLNDGEILDRFADSMHFSITGYGLEKNGRKLYNEPPKIAGWDFLEGFVKSINSITTNTSELVRSNRANSLSDDMNKLHQLMDDATKIMCGEANPSNFIEACKKYLMGDTVSITIDKDTARKYFDAWNAKTGDALLDQTMQEVKNAEKEYGKMIDYLKRLKQWAENINKTKIIDQNSVDALAYRNVEQNISKIFAAITTACTNIENLAMRYNQCISARFQCASTLNSEISNVVARVKTEVMKSVDASAKNETVYLCREDYEIFDDVLTGFCESCDALQNAESVASFSTYINEHVLLIEADAPEEGIGQKLDRLVGLIVNMFSKFSISVNQFVKLDQKWFNDNNAKLKDPNFKFPEPDGNIDDWIPYNTDLISKKIEVDKFDTANADIMGKLESNETFAAHIISKIGGTTSTNTNQQDGNGAFAARCKAIYEGGDKQSIKVSEVQKNKDTYLNYCIGYMQGENGGLFKSIIEDTKTLDESKKTALRELKDKEEAAAQAKKDQEAQKATNDQQTSSQSNNNKSTTVGQSSTPSPNSDASIASQGAAKNEASTEEYGFNLARALGINENSIIYELTMPKVSNSDTSGEGNDGSKAEDNEFKVLKEKCTRYFTMMGNAVGARMSASIQCYKQYRSLLKWAVKGGSTDNATQQQTDDSIAGQGAAAAKA